MAPSEGTAACWCAAAAAAVCVPCTISRINYQDSCFFPEQAKVLIVLLCIHEFGAKFDNDNCVLCPYMPNVSRYMYM